MHQTMACGFDTNEMALHGVIPANFLTHPAHKKQGCCDSPAWMFS